MHNNHFTQENHFKPLQMKNIITSIWFKTNFYTILYFVFILVFSLHLLPNKVLAQNTNKMRRLELKYEQFCAKHKPQQIMLYAHNNMYNPGDTIYFNVIIFNSEGKPDLQEITVFGELISSANSESQRVMLRVNQGFATGYIAIPKTTEPGYYQLQAYTNQMKNFGPRVFAVQSLTIGNTEHNTTNDILISRRKVDLEIQAEGGSIIAGRDNKLFIRLQTDSSYINFAGKITDSDGNLISSFESGNTLFALTTFLAEKGKNYTVEIESPVIKKEKLNVSDKSIALKLNTIDAKSCILQAATDAPNTNKYILLGIQNQKIRFELLDLEVNKDVRVEFSNYNIKPGVLQLYFMNTSGDIISDRLVYVPFQMNNSFTENENLSDSTLYLFSPEFEKFNYQQLLINILNTQTHKKYVFRSNLADFEKEYNHWLIAQQSSWFLPDRIDKAIAVDTTFKPIKNISISGLVSKLFDNRVEGCKVVLSNLEDYFQSTYKFTNNEGKFLFSNLYLKDSAYLYVEAYQDEGKTNMVITMDYESPFANEYLREFGSFTSNDTTTKNTVQSEDEFVIKNSEINTFGNSTANTKPQTIYGDADYVIKMDEKKGFYSSVPQVLAGVPGVRVQGPYVYIRGNPTSMIGSNLPLVLLDGVMTDYSILHQINPNDLDRIEILKSPNKLAMFGIRGGNGVIALYSKQGQFNDAFAIDLNLLGYQTLSTGFENTKIQVVYKNTEKNLGTLPLHKKLRMSVNMKGDISIFQ